jgi:uncharacterized membrane protein YkvA (DUF1232 family)
MTSRKKKPGDEKVSEASFTEKVSALPRWAGRSVLEKALLLYLLMVDPRVPVWAKAIVTGAIVYFVSVIDASPDFLPGVGFADDGVVMAGALAQLGAHVTESHREEARRKADDILGA